MLNICNKIFAEKLFFQPQFLQQLVISVANQDNFAPDPVFNILDTDHPATRGGAPFPPPPLVFFREGEGQEKLI